MQVNLEKFKILIVGTKASHIFYYKGEVIEQVSSYKYLGVHFSQYYSWNIYIQKKIEMGSRALYSLLNCCRHANLIVWKLRKFLFRNLVVPVIFYGIQI